MADRDEQATHWVCPKCGAKLVGRNMWHACGPYTVEAFLEGKGPRALGLFDAFARMVLGLGDVRPAPAKTRVAFMARIRFASINALSDPGLSAHVLLPRRAESPRFTRVDELSPTCFVHHFRITNEDQLDDEVLAWLKESYSELGAWPNET